MGQRYSRIEGKNAREIVLLKSFPCRYGRCSFCNYILDNSTDEANMLTINSETLNQVIGVYGILEVINSGSVFEIPQKTLEEILFIAKKQNIHTIYFEIYYSYISRLQELRDMFSGINLRFRMGLETFDNEFRAKVYNKPFKLNDKDYNFLSKELYSVCILCCVKGQTKEMIQRDIDQGLKYFKSITINIFVDNGTSVTRDTKLYTWFVSNYSHLVTHPKVELLLDNKDLGVFEQ